ncbi:helix-turn-helix transcriptional regulator [Leptolyngbya sp. AN02str]|uniref:helix-turn-helix transcriptional regulator n=1 Tax=Leptolyngbya sp. AN02str TaxID=3423363 RepID=UPI003D31F1C8
MTITLSQADYWQLFDEAALHAAATADRAQDIVAEASPSMCPFPAQLGQGWQLLVPLQPGVELMIEDSCLSEDVMIRHCDRTHPVEFTFAQVTQNGRTHSQYALYGSGLARGELWHLSSGQRTVQITVHLEPELLQRWLEEDAAVPQVAELLRSPETPYYERSGTPTAAMQMTVQQMLNCPFQGLTQRLYLNSKVWELLALLIEDMRSLQLPPSDLHPLKPDDVERIHYASKLLRQRLENPPSLIELARATGINDHKLKVGFRQVFNTTVFGYLHELRLERSRQLLEAGEISVTQAAQAVGFANRGHFAAAFRRKYGVNPGVYLRQKRA